MKENVIEYSLFIFTGDREVGGKGNGRTLSENPFVCERERRVNARTGKVNGNELSTHVHGGLWTLSTFIRERERKEARGE